VIWKRTFPDSAYLFVDTGNFVDVPMAQGEVKTRALAEGMKRLGYKAVGLGERDLDRGYEYLDALRKEYGLTFLSGNAVYQKTGKPVFDPYTILTLTSQEFKALPSRTLKVGITSLVRFNPTLLKPTPAGDNMVVASPADQAKDIIAKLRPKCDFLIVLASMPKDDARLLARSVKGIDLIVAAYGGIVSGAEEREGATRIVYVGNQGKYLAEVRGLKKAQEGWETTQTLHALSASYPEEPKLKEFVASVLEEANKAARKPAAPRPGSAPGGVGGAPPGAAGGSPASDAVRPASAAISPFLGSEACRQCHAKEYQTWSASAHSRAFDALVEKNEDSNAECVGCHVLGRHSRGGFVDRARTPFLVHVQCENCHGPAYHHPERPTAPYGKTGGDAACRACHTSKWTPQFDFAEYWKKIEH
jgi:hypothetical protein